MIDKSNIEGISVSLIVLIRPSFSTLQHQIEIRTVRTSAYIPSQLFRHCHKLMQGPSTLAPGFQHSSVNKYDPRVTDGSG
jgi:hypothetical protein